MGIRPGISRRIDAGLIAQQLLAEDHRYSYVGAKLQGVRLLVEAVPEAPAPALYDVDAPRDLVCAMDGIVVSAVVRSGALCVKPGDAVRRGQVLIRGEEQATHELRFDRKTVWMRKTEINIAAAFAKAEVDIENVKKTLNPAIDADRGRRDE
jgi:hypothetical protein